MKKHVIVRVRDSPTDVWLARRSTFVLSVLYAHPGRLTIMLSSVHRIDLSQNVQKEDWFIKLNPNGRIPVLVDRNRNGFTIFESAAILLYLEQHYDTKLKFSFDARKEPEDYSQLLQWIFFTVSIVSPTLPKRVIS